MNGLSKTTDMPKQYLLEVLGDYLEVENNIGAIIASTGYKNEYIAKKLAMPISTYYTKRRTKSFTAKDIFKIVKMLEDTEDMYNAEELALIEARKNDNDEYISGDEFLKIFCAKMKQ